MRCGELLGVRWQDVDLQAGTLSIKQQLVPVHGTLQIQDVKTPLP